MWLLTRIAPPLTPHLFLPKIIIFTNNYWDKPPRCGQAATIAVGHDRDCYVQFEYCCKQLYHVEKFFKINIGPACYSATDRAHKTFWECATPPDVHLMSRYYNGESLVGRGDTNLYICYAMVLRSQIIYFCGNSHQETAISFSHHSPSCHSGDGK